MSLGNKYFWLGYLNKGVFDYYLEEFYLIILTYWTSCRHFFHLLVSLLITAITQFIVLATKVICNWTLLRGPGSLNTTSITLSLCLRYRIHAERWEVCSLHLFIPSKWRWRTSFPFKTHNLILSRQLFASSNRARHFVSSFGKVSFTEGLMDKLNHLRQLSGRDSWIGFPVIKQMTPYSEK